MISRAVAASSASESPAESRPTRSAASERFGVRMVARGTQFAAQHVERIGIEERISTAGHADRIDHDGRKAMLDRSPGPPRG